MKKLLMLILFPILLWGQTNQVWKYKTPNVVRDGWDNATATYHVTGDVDEESISFSLGDDYNGLLSIKYKSAEDMSNISFQLLVSGGTAYVPIDLTFETITDENGENVYKWKSNPQGDNVAESSPYSTFKVKMIKGAAVDVFLKMTWTKY